TPCTRPRTRTIRRTRASSPLSGSSIAPLLSPTGLTPARSAVVTAGVRRGGAGIVAPVAPLPADDVGRVLAVLVGERAGAQPGVGHLLAQLGVADVQALDPVDHVDHQVVAVGVVAHQHVEGRGGGALLLVTAHVYAGGAVVAVGQPVDQPRVAVVGD